MSIQELAVETLSHYVDGAWHAAAGTAHSPIVNPATGQVIAQAPIADPSTVDHAVNAAHAAFLEWREVPVVERVQPLYKFKHLLEQNIEELAATVTDENGKTLTDSRMEVRRAIQMVEVACGMPSLMLGDSLSGVARGIDSATLRFPIGVCAGITPFNFPAMVPMWMYPFAIACGNTFVLKPSDKTPLTPVLAARLLAEAGLPKGVFNLLLGGQSTVEDLIAHPLVRGVSFVGSTPVARRVYEMAALKGKRVQALGGAKNHLVVMPDADLDKSVEAIMGSAFGGAGERCLAGSVVVTVGEVHNPLVSLLKERIEAMKVGPGKVAGCDMGPVVTGDHQRRILGYIDRGVAEGATLVCDGRPAAKQEGFFVGPTLFDNVTPQMTIAREEIFGPVLSVIRAESLDQAIDLVNKSPFGNASAIFTSSGKAAREYSVRVDAGMVGVNIGVPAPMAFFPFAGWKDSFFGDLHAHGKDAVSFYTEQKVVMSRWF
ncbi:MAG TPA: CoA-acylating methylmalonate-semialdehyde dehydrogenase [Bryobacteraceae bacterium]|nr:CoA-acylating methylmalonate-semialdehyde dehydrogenase [Bryobacteraceae bacterium]